MESVRKYQINIKNFLHVFRKLVYTNNDTVFFIVNIIGNKIQLMIKTMEGSL